MGLLEQGHGGDAGGQVLEGADEADGLLGGGDELEGQLGDDAEGALGADDEVEQGVAGGGLGDGGAHLDDLAGGQDHGHGPDIVAGGAILDGPHAAGVGGDVAAQRGKLLTGIGGIQQALLQGVLSQVVEQHAGLDPDDKVVGIIFQDLLHAHGAQHHTAGDGGAGAHQAGASAAAGHGDVVVIADLHDGGDLFGAQHINGDVGHLGAVDGHLVAGVVGVDVRAHDDAVAGDLLQLFDDFRGDWIVGCHMDSS